MFPQRRTKTTVLIVGEGPKDQTFLHHLKEIYVLREGEIAVKVECGSGGCPRSVIQKAIRLRDSRDYDKCVVFVDGDVPLKIDRELNRRIKEKPRVEIRLIKPCMEGLLLEILRHPNFKRYGSPAGFCKREFEAYIPIGKQTETISYARIFPKHLIDSRRISVPDLNAILKIMGA